MYTPGTPYVTGTIISSTVANNVNSDFAIGLSTAITKNGQTTITAAIPFSNNRITGLGAATQATDAAQYKQVQSGETTYLTSVAGTNTITAALTTPTLTAYAAGNVFRFIAAGNNSGAVTLNINSIGAKSITKNGANALITGDILTNVTYEVIYDGTQFQLIGANFAPFSDASPLVKGSSDATKLLAFEVDTNQPTATTVTITTQSTSGTMELVQSQIKPINAVVAANAMTLTLNPCSLAFRSSTLGSGTVNVRAVNTAITTVISSGSTLGTVNAVQSRLTVIAIDNAGTVELAVVNPSNGLDLSETGLITTVAEGGAGAADSANVIYSTTARSNVPYRVVGYVESTQATAGTWATAPSTIQGEGGLSSISTVMNSQGAAPMFACRAFINFNGTGTPAIRSAGNISSITDNGVGDYQINFTTALPDANYAVSAWCNYNTASKVGLVTGNSTSVKTASALQIFTVNSSTGTGGDVDNVSLVIHR